MPNTKVLAFFIWFILFIVFLSIISWPSEVYFRKKRKNIVKAFFTSNDVYSDFKSDIIFKKYILNDDVDYLKEIVLKIKFLSIALQTADMNHSIGVMSTLLEKNEDLKAFSKILNNEISEEEKIHTLINTDTFELKLVRYSKKNGLIINQERVNLVTDFYNFVIEN